MTINPSDQQGIVALAKAVVETEMSAVGALLNRFDQSFVDAVSLLMECQDALS